MTQEGEAATNGDLMALSLRGKCFRLLLRPAKKDSDEFIQ